MYSTIQGPVEQGRLLLSDGSMRMDIMAITHGDSCTSLPKPKVHLQSPPVSTSRSPLEAPFSSVSRDCSPHGYIACLHGPRNKSFVRLPSIGEFDLGVKALERSYGPVRPYTPLSPLPSLRRISVPPQTLAPLQEYLPQDLYAPYHRKDTYLHDVSALDGYPSPPPDDENRHIGQKYTTEEGDFIIYAWHDKKLKWQRIKQEFAVMFGRTPERTVQGLQAWYYRMNQRIPLWDQDGWLIFDNEDDLEPKYISIKCRERDSQGKPMEPLGLAQRHPERALYYSWVDSELKRKSQDWAAKRAMQYHKRRERRKRKERRRLKL